MVGRGVLVGRVVLVGLGNVGVATRTVALAGNGVGVPVVRATAVA